MIDNDEQLLFLRYWKQRIELTAVAADRGILAGALPMRLRRPYVEAAYQISRELHEQITAYERSKPP